MSTTSRRAVLQAGAALVAMHGLPNRAGAAEDSVMTKPHDAFNYQHVVAPLPFDAKKLTGLSARMIESHWENNYGGAVKALNTLRLRLVQGLNDTNPPPYVYNGLKREQLLRTGSVVLHELYFANLGG